MHGYSGILAMVVMSWVSLGISAMEKEKPKPEKCEGTLMVSAVIPDIKGVNNQPYSQFVGNMTYSLAMNGTFALSSSVPTWHCSPIKTESQSTGTMRTMTNVYTSAQMACAADQLDVDSSWITKFAHMNISGLFYVSVIAHGGICASAPTVLENTSVCNYNATTDGGLLGHGDCHWATVDQPRRLGDVEAEQAASGGGGQ